MIWWSVLQTWPQTAIRMELIQSSSLCKFFLSTSFIDRGQWRCPRQLVIVVSGASCAAVLSLLGSALVRRSSCPECSRPFRKSHRASCQSHNALRYAGNCGTFTMCARAASWILEVVPSVSLTTASLEHKEHWVNTSESRYVLCYVIVLLSLRSEISKGYTNVNCSFYLWVLLDAQYIELLYCVKKKIGGAAYFRNDLLKVRRVGLPVREGREAEIFNLRRALWQ